ncbi:MAG: hypothetical protein GXO50_02710 [Chlorobi bacterium]|nr:hypothetical protein [Chlorobiota bacterium]
MKKTLLIFLILKSSLLIYSQEKNIDRHNTFFDAVYGSNGFNIGEIYISVNINLEKTLYNTEYVKINGRTAAGFWAGWAETGIEAPLTGQIILFKRSSHLEIGAGGYYFYDFYDDTDNGFGSLLNMAYRFQKPEGGFLFRAGVEKNKYLAYFILSLGYAF